MPTTEQQTCTCPVCDASLDLPAGTEVNELVPCSDCGAELELTSLEPLKLEEAPEIEEDWGE